MDAETGGMAPLMQPLAIRGVSLRNRLAMAPMTRSFCPDSVPTDANAAYYRRRAEGGAGLIVTEAIGTDHPASIGDTGLGETDLPRFIGDRAVAAWKSVVDAVHAAGSHIIPQVWHQGAMRLPNTGPYPDIPAFSPSGHYGDKSKAAPYYKEMAEKLAIQGPIPTDAEIVEVIESFGRAADQAVAAGFDGLALHGSSGYLLDQFLWAETNRRTDRWGGDIKARTLFATEVIKQVRRALGPDRPLFFRFSQWKQQDFRARLAETPDELEQVLGPLADAGVDLFDANVRYFDTPAFDGSELSLAGWAKKLTGKLSGTVGGVGVDKGMFDTLENKATQGINNLPRAIKRFEAGEFDIISIGRAILSDAQWINKAHAGEPLSAFNAEALNKLA